MSEIQHGRFQQSEKVTDFRCRFCGQPATIWLRIPLGKDDEAEFETFCDNHALKTARALLQDVEFPMAPGDSAKRIMESQMADQTA